MPDNLVQKQGRFVEMTAMLIQFAKMKGYLLTYGDAYRCPAATWGHPNSCHRARLAVDFNLFIDGVYKTATSEYLELGKFWESIGGSWGGRFEAEPGRLGKDGNHFSLAHDGMK